MFRASVISLSLIFQAQAFAAPLKSCSHFVQAYSEYTQKVEGKIVKKHSIFDMTDWSRNSRFQGLVLTDKAAANAEVTLMVNMGNKVKAFKAKKTTPFVQDEKYRVVDLDLQALLGKAPSTTGDFRVVVAVNNKVLCSEKKLIYNDGD